MACYRCCARRTLNGMVEIPTPADLSEAYAAVRAQLAPTPLVHSRDGLSVKLECWQPTGSFKVRGAIAALSALPKRTPVVTASTGNHALAVAWAAERLGIEATVVVPQTASPAKLTALAALNGRVVRHGADFDAAESHALDLAARGATYVSPYNHTRVIAGQSTLGRELGEQVEGAFTVVVPVGGGGLASGLALWAAGRDGVRVIGVEAAASRAVSAAMAAGTTVTVPVGPTLADALAGNVEPGSVTPGILAAQGVPVLGVSEEDIRGAMRYLVRVHGLAVEGGGAVAVAAVLSGAVESTGPVVAVVTGRNVALPTLAQVLGG
ncbi:serine/threonine dehydratase [Virgisporangium aliadipatigenens]|uniref:threonine ammonia-lyase n=1 Tax=Virgisporangium aliadipatigenens TaxID=741659 RepID=A0A8J3YMP0_9ACTN|nr:pyridoxal-phosphate dependent enzyme [Virgisporangium aliadipatigenens]GIJ46680.1 serine/threonine dehydratase [Virgisporangium aliadipatigenens]